MRVKAVLGHLDHRHRNVGAVVGNALVDGQQVVQHKAVFDRAGTGLQAGDVPRLDLAHKAVHDLLERFDLGGGVAVPVLESVHRAVEDVLHGGFQHREVVQRLGAEADVLVADLARGLGQVDRVVVDALKVADGVQQRVDGAVVGGRKLMPRQLDQVAAQHVPRSGPRRPPCG